MIIFGKITWWTWRIK